MLKRLVAAALQARRRHGYRAFAARCRDVGPAQSALLARLVARNGHTALARRLGVTGVRTLDDLRRVPLTEFDAIRPELDAALDGAPDQLVAGRPAFFGMTSGTTGYAKHIPLDEAYRAEFQSTVQHFLYGIVRDHPDALAHKALYCVGPAALEITPGGTPAGTISGYNLRRLSRLLQSFYAVPPGAFDVADPDAQAYTVARFALAHELSIAFAVTTAPLAAVGRTIERDAERLFRDVHDGTLDAELDAATRRALCARLRPDPARARTLARRASAGARAIPRHLFPTLRLISCWHHASGGVHLGALRELWGDVSIRPAIYSATEAWMNVPLADAHPTSPPSGVLACDAVVLELMAPDGTTRFAHELDALGRYEVVLTSGAGLWRYRIGDEVEVTGFFEARDAAAARGRAPLFHFVQKSGSVVSVAHDMTTEAHVRSAVASALPDARRWVFGPSPGASDRYRLVLEREGAPGGAGDGGDPAAPAAHDHLERALDEALRRANMGYEDDRRDGALAPLELVCRASADFDRWERARHASAMAQHKPVVLVKHAHELP